MAGSSAGSATSGGGGMSSGGAGGASGSAGAVAGGSAGAAGAGGGGTGPCMPAEALVCSPMIPFPASLQDTGLFPALPDLAQHHARAHLFAPSPALWSDGLAKERLVVLPEGTTIDNSDSVKWKFPEGTLMVKTFFDDGGPSQARRAIETRFIRRGPDPVDPFAQWEFAVYQWNAENTDATLVSFDDPMMSTPVQVVVDRMENGQPLRLNDGMPFTHDIPSKQNCQGCHNRNAKTTEADVIGFDELRLNSKLPGAEKTQLEALVELKVLSTMPAAPKSIVEADPVLLRVKAWVHGNCVHCHNGAEGMLDLHPDVFVQETVDQASEGAGITPPSADWKRVVPKQPELSILFVQARRSPLPDGPSVQMRAMPPIGVAIADDDALADLAAWINALP